MGPAVAGRLLPMIETTMWTDFDVAIVGYGPVGQGLAAMLGQAGYRVGVFERWPSLYPLPRACVVDHEIMRVLQSVGVADEFAELAVPTDGEYVWLNAQGQTLYHFKYDKQGISGWPARNLMYQPDLEAVLDKKVRTMANVELNQGWEAVSYAEHAERCELVVAAVALDEKGQLVRGDQTRRITARCVVGADGANSFVRQAAGMRWTDLGFRADWLVVDFRPNHPERALDMPQAGQICDPARPITLMRHMGKKHVRWEMMLLPGETAQDITQPAKVWSMIDPWVKPGDGVIDRAAVYTFRSGVAENWVKGRAILAGDAAHLMPPFLGQGLCSGMRDALAVFWRLDLVLRDKAPAALLHSYEEERKRHVTTVIERAVALGKVVCITDPVQAAQRDAAILSGTAPPIPPFPGLTSGVLHRASDGGVAAPVGQPALQARVSIEGKAGRFDDVVGGGWCVLTLDQAIDGSLSDAQHAFVAHIAARLVTLRRDGAGVVDVDGAYRRYMDGLGAKALIVRPDFYVFAAASSLEDVPLLLDELRAQLGLEPSPAVSAAIPT
jgi:2-polyprenyl-6-methoxyphenol hydroxylase-like FAD-dependent oxidoreductase